MGMYQGVNKVLQSLFVRILRRHEIFIYVRYCDLTM